MKKPSKVVMLPTEKASKILTEDKILKFNPTGIEVGGNVEYQHLYFLSNDEIKEEDWFIQADGGDSKPILRKLVTEEEYHKTRYNNHYYPYYTGSKSFPSKSWGCKKIIASTDESLGLPRPSNEFIKKYCKLGSIDEVLVEYECDHSQMPNKIIDILKVAPDNTITIYSVNNGYRNIHRRELS